MNGENREPLYEVTTIHCPIAATIRCHLGLANSTELTGIQFPFFFAREMANPLLHESSEYVTRWRCMGDGPAGNCSFDRKSNLAARLSAALCGHLDFDKELLRHIRATFMLPLYAANKSKSTPPRRRLRLGPYGRITLICNGFSVQIRVRVRTVATSSPHQRR